MDVWLHQKKPQHDHCYNPCITHWDTSVMLHIFFFVKSVFPDCNQVLLSSSISSWRFSIHRSVNSTAKSYLGFCYSQNGRDPTMDEANWWVFFPFTLWLYDSSAQSDMCQTSYCAAWYLFNLTMSIWLVFTAWLQYLNFYKPCLFICRQVVLFGNFNNKTCLLSWKCSSTLKILFSHSDSMTLPWVQLETVHSVLLFLLPVN